MTSSVRSRVAVALLLVAAAGAAYAFRWRTFEHPQWGSVRQVWRWGRAAEMRMDRNGDGKPDLRMLYERGSAEFDHNPPDEYWEDTNFDGTYDVRVTYAGMLPAAVHFDKNGDGVFERELRGDAARAYRDQNPPRAFRARGD